ncbi:hypothetical protein BC830DRAFT_1169177 [Chytriomyces sp. MP71]|nr:hypothetical protein BC830DRAFT_1169177 [Chytriomyces sp. MP71]
MATSTIFVTSTVTRTSTATVGATSAATQAATIIFTSGNIQTNMFRGVSIGVSLMALLMCSFFWRHFPPRTTVAAVIMALVVFTVQVICVYWDLFPPTDCQLRVKTIYGLIFFQMISYWSFQAELTYRVAQAYAKTVPYTPYIIAMAFVTRATVNVYLISVVSWTRGANNLCSTMLAVGVNLGDRVMEAGYSLVLSVLFLVPIVAGYKEISAYAAPTGCAAMGRGSIMRQSVAGTAPLQAVDRITEGTQWLRRIIMDKGFVLVLSVLIEVVYVILVFSGISPPTLVSFWNAVFTPQFLILMSVHLLSTVSRKVGDSGATTRMQQTSSAKH